MHTAILTGVLTHTPSICLMSGFLSSTKPMISSQTCTLQQMPDLPVSLGSQHVDNSACVL